MGREERNDIARKVARYLLVTVPTEEILAGLNEECGEGSWGREDFAEIHHQIMYADVILEGEPR